MVEWYSIAYMHRLYPFLCWWTFGRFHVLATVCSAAVNIRVQVSFWIGFSGYMPSSGIPGSYGCSIFSFLKKESSYWLERLWNLLKSSVTVGLLGLHSGSCRVGLPCYYLMGVGVQVPRWCLQGCGSSSLLDVGGTSGVLLSLCWHYPDLEGQDYLVTAPCMTSVNTMGMRMSSLPTCSDESPDFPLGLL